MDALEHDDLVLLELDGLGRFEHTHLAGKLVFGHINALALSEQVKVLVQKLHIETQGRLKVDLTLGGAGGGGRVYRHKIIVHADIVGVHALAFQLLAYLASRGRLTRARGAGQKNDGAVFPVRNYFICGGLDTPAVNLVAFLDKAFGVGDGLEVDITELICHVHFTFL